MAGEIETYVRPVKAGEVPALMRLARETFIATFAPVNTKSTMDNYVGENFRLDVFEAEYANPNSHFFFAECSGEIAGYLKLNFGTAQTEHKLDDAMEIERIYVSEKFHGMKVAQALFVKTLQVGKDAGVDWVWLGVEEANVRAVRFYEKNGFEVFGQHAFQFGEELQTDLLMRRGL